MLDYLAKNPGFSDDQARVLVKQITTRRYNPPKRERILKWMRLQEFLICPEPDNAGRCSVYHPLEFPQELYERMFYDRGERNN